MSFIEYRRELSGSIPQLSDILAGTLVNRAWAELRDSRGWSWLVAEDAYFVPSPLSGGVVTLTQFSKQVQFDDTAAAVAIPQILANPPISERQFRVAGGGAIYNVAGFDNNANILTLERDYLEPDGASTAWTIYKAYYPAPTHDFKKFLSVLNPTSGYPITEENLGLNKAEIDRMDPQRGSTGDPYYAAFYRMDPVSQLPVFEFWPHPVNSYQLPFIYASRGSDFVNDDDAIPLTLQTYSFMELCHYHACMWAAKNAGRHVELRGVNWLSIAAGHMNTYQKWLQKAKVTDDEIYLKSWGAWGRAGSGQPLDAKYAQSHDMNWI